MMRSFAFGCFAALAFAGGLVACNGLLGIGAASVESDDGGSGVDAPVRAATCAYYCSTVTANCTQSNAEFVGSEDPNTLCNSICLAYDSSNNSIGPTNDDTLGCRIYYAEQAATDPGTNCRFAGPLGGGTCGTDPCQLFCSLDLQYCNNAPISTPAYASVTDCLTACENNGYPYLTTGQDLLDSTNTLNCRFWHLENAYGSTPSGQFHCPHTVQASPVCK